MIARSIVGAIQTCWRDRKSTRLNSSHGYISYAVFCLKKKKNNQLPDDAQHTLDHLAEYPSTPSCASMTVYVTPEEYSNYVNISRLDADTATALLSLCL